MEGWYPECFLTAEEQSQDSKLTDPPSFDRFRFAPLCPHGIMPSPSAHDVIHAFARVIRKQLADGQSVEVPDLGTFRVEHQSSEIEEHEDGETSLSPPQDVVEFESDL